MSSIIRNFAIPSLAAVQLAITSCAPTVGDRLIAHGGIGARALGTEWNRGKEMIEQGEQTKIKGEKLVREGDRLIADGNKIQTTSEAEASRAGYLGGP